MLSNSEFFKPDSVTFRTLKQSLREIFEVTSSLTFSTSSNRQELRAVNAPDPDAAIRHESAGDPPNSSAPREIDSSSLLRGEREILIRHGEEVYRLKVTRNDKLILQK